MNLNVVRNSINSEMNEVRFLLSITPKDKVLDRASLKYRLNNLKEKLEKIHPTLPGSNVHI